MKTSTQQKLQKIKGNTTVISIIYVLAVSLLLLNIKLYNYISPLDVIILIIGGGRILGGWILLLLEFKKKL